MILVTLCICRLPNDRDTTILVFAVNSLSCKITYNAILYSDFIKAVGRAVVDIGFKRYSSGGCGRGIGNDANCTSCMW